jgi:hypothetical protein
VTATDEGDALFARANRGDYVAVAAPLLIWNAIRSTAHAAAIIMDAVWMLSGCMSRFQPADIQGRMQSSGKARWLPSAGADIIAAGPRRAHPRVE